MSKRHSKSPEKFTAYDSADYLDTEGKVVAYLSVALEEGGDDPAFLTHALGVVARARNMSGLARTTKMSREGLYKALSADGNPSFGTVLRVVRAMGLGLSVYGSNRSKRQPSPAGR